MDPRKVEWATPTSYCEVMRFTGLANYYRRFAEGYSEVAVAAPLSSPTARFVWSPAAQASFDALRPSRPLRCYSSSTRPAARC